MTAKVRIEYVRLTHPGGLAGDADVVAQVLGAGETLAIGAVNVPSTAAPAFPADRGLTGGVHARITCVLGSVIVAAPATTSTATEAGGVRLEAGEDPMLVPIATGQVIGFLEALVADDIVALQTVLVNGATLSPLVDLGSQRLHRIRVPAGWTAAALSFQEAQDGVTFADIYTDASEYSIGAGLVAAGRSFLVDQALFWGVRFLKVRSGLTDAPVNQLADRTLTLITAPR